MTVMSSIRWLLALTIACAGACSAGSAGSRAATPVAPATPPAQPRSDPKPGRVVVTDTAIEVLSMHFIGGTTRISPESSRFLDSVASTLDGNPTITLVEVQAYGSGAPPAGRLDLAMQRARMVIDELVRRGVARGRLRPAGVAHRPPRAASDIGLLIITRASTAPVATPLGLP